MVNGDGRAWSIRDPERFNARFRIVNQILNIGRISKNGARLADIKAYAKEHPAEGQKLTNLRTIGQISGVSAVLGLVGSTTAIWRWSRTPPLVVVGGIMGTVAAMVASEDVASLAMGTYKFDNHQAVEDFLCMVKQTRWG